MSRIRPTRPVEQKPEKAERNRAYMGRVAQLPCCICEAFGMAQTSPTQVHHCTHGRYSTSRAPDHMTIPLCEGHHQGLRDTSKLAIHQGKKTWLNAFGADYEWAERIRERLGRTFFHDATDLH